VLSVLVGIERGLGLLDIDGLTTFVGDAAPARTRAAPRSEHHSPASSVSSDDRRAHSHDMRDRDSTDRDIYANRET